MAVTVLSYDDWNESVGRYCFSPYYAGKHVRLAVDPLVLQRAAAEGPRRHHFTSPEAAADDFRTAVTHRINETNWEIGSTHQGVFPLGLAKLALQVLAVFYISRDDEEGISYWAALWEALGRTVDKRGVKPEDLDLDTHQDNWAALARWANDLNRGQLGIIPEPDSHAGGRRHVRLPLSHGLLRKEDIQGLDRFFGRIGLSPGKDLEPAELIEDLRFCAADPSVFRGAHARRVLTDERLLLAADQIANAAAQWDGQQVDLAKSRGPVVRLWLTVRAMENRRILGGLTQIHPTGTNVDVTDITLADLLGPNTIRQRVAPVPYRPLNSWVFAVQSLVDGRYVEQRYLRPGDKCVVLRPKSERIPQYERDLLRIATTERIDKFGEGTAGLPKGWVVYRLRIREIASSSEVPDALAGLIKFEQVHIGTAGGLRVRGAWLEGAGPSIVVRGGDARTVIVDGVEYTLTAGRLHPERCPALSKLGVHEAWLPGRHRDRVRFRVYHPKPAKLSSLVVEAGWAWNPAPEWPSRLAGLNSNPQSTVRGPVIEGEWPPARIVCAHFQAAERAAARLAIVLRNPASAGGPAALAALKIANENHPNLLVRQLARALTPGNVRSQR